jgi:hypothetical protein
MTKIHIDTIHHFVAVVLQSDLISSHEEKFFRLFDQTPPVSPQIVRTLQDFKNNLINRFVFDKIHPFINFDEFILAGDSVLMSILHHAPCNMTADLDFFYVDHSFNDFIRSFV